VVLSTAAWARQPSDREKGEARAAVQRGDKLMRTKAYKGALNAYRRADAIMGVPTTSIEVGRALLELGRRAEALEALSRAANHPKRAGEPEPYTAARKDAAELAEEVMKMLSTLTVKVAGAPRSKTRVTVGGRHIEGPVVLDPGNYVVAASAPGFATARTDITLRAGDDRAVELTLEPESSAATDGSGDLPGGDREPAGGSDAPAEPQASPFWAMAAAGFTISGVALTLGAVTGILSLRDATELNEQCGDDRVCPPDLQGKLDRSRALGHTSTASFAVGGAAAAIGIVGMALALTDADSQAGSASLMLSVGDGVSLFGRF
jgi:hypothetical protein